MCWSKVKLSKSAHVIEFQVKKSDLISDRGLRAIYYSNIVT
jgi:hypothetical protein